MNAADFLADFHHLATIGATPANGVERQAATAADAQTRTWFVQQMEAAGFTVRVDGIGNVFALLEWSPDAPYVLIGSHLDSQPRGGRFDGAYGVVAAMHAAQRVRSRIERDGTRPPYNLAVVDWFNEEGSRFQPSIMGSSVFTGLFDAEETLQIRDPQGITVHKALADIGFLGSDRPPTVASYAEIHIEQGRILERESVDIGLVERSWHSHKLDIEVLGEQSHTGATAMADRHDALVAAVAVVQMVNEVTTEFEEEAMVSSVGQLFVEPNSPIVVPRRVHLVADLRSGDAAIVQTARDRLAERIATLADQHDLTINVCDFDIRPVGYFDADGVDLAARCAAGLGYSARRLPTMAGHDSVAMNTTVPSVMLFIPSIGGVSHCEREYSTDQDMTKGVDLLTEVTHELAHGALVDPSGPAA